MSKRKRHSKLAPRPSRIAAKTGEPIAGDPAVARQLILRVVDNQLRDNQPPETRTTYERLMHDGHSDDSARRLIALALASEIWRMLHDHVPHDRDRYIANLKRLPAEPEV